MNLSVFGKFHIAREGISLCHTREGILISYDDAAGMNPTNCCEDCRLRYRNLTGNDLKKQPIDKSLLRAQTEFQPINTNKNEH